MNDVVQIIRTSSRYWIQEIGGIALLFFVLPIIGILYLGEKMYLLGGLLIVSGIPYFASETIKAYKQKIIFSHSDINTGEGDTKIGYELVKAVRFIGHGKKRLIFCTMMRMPFTYRAFILTNTK